MAVTFLISSLVFLHALLQSASSQDVPSAPTLSVEPQYTEYYEGERITLTCAASVFPYSTVERYIFFDRDEQPALITPPNVFQKAKFKIQINSGGKYSCRYQMKANGTEVRSAESNPIFLKVYAAPLAPNLSVNPKQEIYKLGDNVSLVCSVPFKTRPVKEFQFYGDKIASSAVPSHSSIYKYNMTITDWENVGLFECAYAVTLSGRNVLSKRSNAVVLATKGARWERMLAVGGSFFTINGLIFLISHWCF